MHARTLVLPFAILVTTVLSGQADRLTIADLGLEVTTSAPSLSPDGRSVVVVTSRANYQDNRFDRALVLIDIATGVQTNLTPGRTNVSGPRWSPDGRQLAFSDSPGEGGTRQLFVLPTTGGEARQVTHGKKDAGEFGWTSDGVALLYRVADVAKEAEGEERHNKSFEVGDNSYLTRTALTPVQLWRVPAGGGEGKALTQGGESVDDFVISPDGRHVAIAFLPHADSSSGTPRVIRALDLASGRTKDLLTGFGSLQSFSPDGRVLAFSRPRGDSAGFDPSGIVLYPVDGGAPKDATPQLDRSVGGVAWLPGGAFLVSGPDRWRGGMWRQPPDGPPERLDLGQISPGAPIAGADGTVVFVGREPQRAAEVYVMRAGEWKPRRLTAFNDALAARRLGKTDAIHWQGPDGFEEHGVLVYPPDFQPGRKYPLVLNIHGGPMGTSIDTFDTFNQVLAARGWLVFSPNYRGSNGQGKAFQTAVINDAGDGPGRDVMSGIAALKAMGIVDERRIAVSGWSYGGYMTAWLTAHYDGWAAAVAGAAVTDWFDWYNMADMNTWAGFGLGGSPWLNDNAANYWRQSPMAYAHRIRTPTLVLSDIGDERVTVSQSYKLFHALKDNGVEVRFIAYPVGGHFPADPVHQRDIRRRWLEWIADHFGRVSGS